MKRSLLSLFLTMTVIGSVVFSGCSKPPEAEQAAARAAMAVSRSAGADKYAPADFMEATKLWIASEALAKEKKYQKAQQGYIDAKAAFEKSVGDVEEGKKVWIGPANAAIAELEEGWRKLEVIAKQAEPRMANKKLWEVDLQNFQEGLQAAKEMVNTDPAEAKAKADHLARFIDTYNVYFKNLAANPARPRAIRAKAHAREED